MPDEDGDFLSRRLRWEDGKQYTPDAGGAPEAASTPAPAADAELSDQVGWADDEDSATGYFATGTASGHSFERRELERIDAAALDRRRQLWRDTAFILSGLVIALLVANIVFPQITGLAGASASPFGSELTIGASPSPEGAARPTQDAGEGPGDAPTKAPHVTLPPTGTHPPATPRPTRTPKPTRAPTPRPTEQPTPEVTPPPTPPPTEAPPPTEPPPTPEPTPAGP